MIQDRVIREFHEELERAKLPGYVSRYDDFDHEDAPPPRRENPARAVERTHVQPAEQQPRGPHRTPASTSRPSGTPHLPNKSSVPPPASNSKPKPGNFGAGIF
jgi:stage V sporulation protein G